MDADAFLALQVDEVEDGHHFRQLGSREDPRETVSNPNEYHCHFRMSPEYAEAIVELILEDLEFKNQRGNPLSPMQQF